MRRNSSGSKKEISELKLSAFEHYTVPILTTRAMFESLLAEAEDGVDGKMTINVHPRLIFLRFVYVIW